MKIKSLQLPFTKKSVLLVCFFAIIFIFASFTKEDRYKVRAFKLKMMEKYINHHAFDDSSENDQGKTNRNNLNTVSTLPSLYTGNINENIINTEQLNLFPEVFEHKNIDQVFDSEEKQGMIGEFSDDESDNPSDNFFTISIPAINTINTKAYLVYDLFGLESFHSVSRSINKNVAFGGNIILPSSKWNLQREEISFSSLKEGKNSILFTSSINGIKYKVRNVKIVFEKGLSSLENISSLRSGDQLYIKGIQNTNFSNPVLVGNKSLVTTYGEYESVIELTEENKAQGSIMIKNANGVKEYKIPESISSFKTLNEGSYTPLTINISKDNEYNETYEDAKVSIEKNSVGKTIQVQILKLRKKDYPAVSREIKNMTANSSAYRLSIKSGVLEKKIKLSIPYDDKKLGATSAKEVKAFYFDYTSKKWKVDPTSKVDAEKKVVTVEADGDTDYINGVISVPESSQLESFAPTSISGLKAADPTAGLQLMGVPSANQKGDANANYPIRVPSGLGGLQPSLSIGYSSGGGNGWMGDGWNINGLSSITVDTRWGVPAFDTENGGTETELYSLDGEMLVYPNQYLPHRHNNVSENNTAITTAKQQRSAYTDPSNSQVKKFYLRKNHDFSLIERIGNAPGNYTWKVTSTDGTKRYYGGSPDSVLSGGGGISHWGLRMIEDVHGNTMDFKYYNVGGGGQFYQIEKISYGKNKDYTVNFIRETSITRKDISINAKQGFARSEPYLLKEIQVKYKTELVRTYKMDYIDGEFYKTLLKRIYIVPHNPCSTTLASKSEIRDIDDGSGGGGGQSGGILPTCNEITDSYTFDYYNDVKDSQGNVKLFGQDTTINLQNDKTAYSGIVSAFTHRPSKINGNVSSESGLNVRPTAGLNFFTTSNNPWGHLMFGFPFGTSKAKARNAQQLIDFNGDGIQDMIYRVPNEGLFLRTGTLNAQGDLSFANSLPIENFPGGDFSFTETTTTSNGRDMGAVVLSQSRISSTSKGTTKTYLTDANSDGLMDIVHDGEVWFNKFNGTTSEMTRHSEYTENMVVKAKAVQAPIKWCGDVGAVPEPCPEDFEEPEPITDVVKVWIAPMDGYVKFTDNLSVGAPASPSQKMYYSVDIKNPTPSIDINGNNVYNNTRIYLKELNSADAPQNIVINRYNDYYNQMQTVPVDTNYNTVNGINNANRLFVKSGDKIYVRLHKNKVKDIPVFSNPEITYVDQNSGNDIPNTNELSQDQFKLNNGKYGSNFFMNNLIAPIYLDAAGTATINVQSFTLPYLTDDVKFRIVKENVNTGILTELLPAPEIYNSAYNTTQAHTINVTVNSGEPVYLRFIVESDSQTNFINGSWNNKITVDYNVLNNPNLNLKYVAIPEYPSFAVTQLKQKLDIANIPNPGVNSSTYFSVQINKNITNFSSLGTGSFYYIIKSQGNVYSKRRVIVSGGSNNISFLEEKDFDGQTINGVSPIFFVYGNPSGQIFSSVTIEVYCKTAGDYDLYNKYSEYFGGHPFNIYYGDMNLNVYGTTSATAVNTAMFNNRTTLYNNWGQFLYKPGEFSNYKYGYPIDISDFAPPVAPQNTYAACLNDPNLDFNDQAAVANCILNTTNIPTTGLPQDRVAPMKTYCFPAKNGAIIQKWVGSGPEQYSMAAAFNTDENVNYFTDPVANLPVVTPTTLASGQLSADTTMKAISRNSKSSSRNITNTTSVSYNGIGATLGESTTTLTGIGSVETQTFSDMNGDGYPDIVYPGSIQYTNSTGSLENIQLTPYTELYPTKSLSYQKNLSAGFSYNGFSVTGRIGANGSNGTTTQAINGMPWSGSASIGTNYTDYYDSYDKGDGFWMDLNGDGLPDRISNGGSSSIIYSLNLGKTLAGNAAFENLLTYSSHPKPSSSFSLGGDLGSFANLDALSSFGFGINAGVSSSSSTGSADVVYEDVNGDGLIDILEVNKSTGATQVRYNLGSKFNLPVPLLKTGGDINFADETKSSNGSFTFGGSFVANFGPIILIPPTPVLILWVKVGIGANVNLGLNVSETKKAFKDMNGDGFTDLVQDTNSGFIVNYSQMGRTNKLKSITNTISKGKYLLDYQFARANYNNPHAKLVVNKISIVEPDVFSQNYTKEQGNKMETNYTFLNRKYDRRERDDFGFDTVIRQEMNGASAERISTDYYYNNTYLMNGVINKSIVQNGSGSYLSEVIYDYKVRNFINSTSQIDLTSDLGTDYDIGGSEGRKMATAMLVQKQNKVFESGGDITTTEQFKYSVLGLMVQYQYISPSVSYNSNITYQSFGNNIIGVPALIEVYDGNTQSTLLRQRRAENINYYTGDVGSYVTFDGTQDIITDVEYNAAGNVKKITYPPNNDSNGQRYVINYTYDDLETGKYVTKVKDNFNIESKANYNPLFDVVIRKVDTGGNAMVFYYDGFGRPRTIMGPNEIAANSAVPTVKYNYWTDHAGIPNTDATVKIYRASTANYDPEHASSNNTINTDTYADFLGRIVQAKKDIQTGNGESRSVSGKTVFDGLGRVIIQMHPSSEYLLNQNLNTYGSGAGTSSSYDSRDRVISATDEDGNTKYISYAIENNLLKVTEEFSNQKSESYSNAEGKIILKNDYLGAQPLSTTFNYSTIGELLEVQDPEGISTSYSYDMAGRRTQQSHPDKGITSYEYDPAGNLVKLTTDNLLNDSTINTHFIKYKYDFNRLSEIVLPDLPSGDPNPNNVMYQYGLYTAGNNAGKLVYKADGTGETGYKYGRMGEVISESRIIRGTHIPEMYFKTYFNYDSWNRITKIKYPDDEIVSYHYDLGGNLQSVDNNYGETYIQDIRYDYFEQREVITFGNGTSQHYNYDQQNRRLDRYFLYDSSYNMLLNNTYKYDEFANIIRIKNEAYPLANGMGGAYQSYFGYDTLNRLTGTGSDQTILDGEMQPIQNTFIAPTTYQLEMEYNNAGGIVQKLQHHERDQNVVHENTYKNKYEYVQNTHKLEKVYDNSTGNSESFDYDYNGNAVNHNDQNGTKKLHWDEQDRLKAFYDDHNAIYQYYTYDDKGERTIKYGLETPAQLYQNGVPLNTGDLRLFEYKIYPNPYLTVSSTGQYTKHYFEGSKRFASRLMDGAVRYEDPTPLYTTRTPEDIPAGKPADFEADFKKYLEKSDLGQNVSVELREVYQSPDLYYLHGDHLGTATFVTNSQSQATQFFLNLPFGETMMEQMDGSYNNPFKFNAKELDEDTGLYYYGARYYNPRLSIWYGVDPLAGKYPNLSPYVYVANNPIKYIDPDGKRIIIWTKRGDGSYIQTEYSYKKNRDYKEYGYSYQRNALMLLDKMYEEGVNTDFIDKAVASKKDLNIIKSSSPGFNNFTKDIGLKKGKKELGDMRHVDPNGSIGTLYWDDESAIDIVDNGGGKIGSISPAGAGLHEINHAEEAFFNPLAHQTNTAVDEVTDMPVVKPPVGFPNQEEYRNTNETNSEAEKMKLPDSKRTIHGQGTSRKVGNIFKN